MIGGMLLISHLICVFLWPLWYLSLIGLILLPSVPGYLIKILLAFLFLLDASSLIIFLRFPLIHTLLLIIIFHMNRIRSHWKNNGTPFFFFFNDCHQSTYLDSHTCSRYDKVIVDDEHNLTAMDSLVDIHHVVRALAFVDDSLVKSSVMEALSSVVDNLKYVVSLHYKNK